MACPGIVQEIMEMRSKLPCVLQLWSLLMVSFTLISQYASSYSHFLVRSHTQLMKI